MPEGQGYLAGNPCIVLGDRDPGRHPISVTFRWSDVAYGLASLSPGLQREAVQSPESSLGDPELHQGQWLPTLLGIPMPCSCNFADVYEAGCPDGFTCVGPPNAFHLALSPA